MPLVFLKFLDFFEIFLLKIISEKTGFVQNLEHFRFWNLDFGFRILFVGLRIK